MTQKLQFKRYRNIAQSYGMPLSFSRKLSPKQKVLLQKCSNLLRKRKKLSYFGQKLQAKRVFAFLYGNLSHKHFALLLKQASKYKGVLSAHFISLIEKRLDVVLYRMFHFRTLPSVRQYIRHHGVFVNNTLTHVSHLQVQPGDILRLKDPEEILALTWFKTQRNSHFPIKFPHVEVNYTCFTGIFLYAPKQVYYSINVTKDDLIPTDV